MALVLEAKPTARRDIISAILSHYGDERDLDLDDHDDVLAAYCQASPTPGPLDRSSKPLPSVPLTQLRDRGRGMHRMASDDSTQEPRARIMAPRSLSRSKRPPELRLVKSNGSTATSAKTPSQSSSPPADSPSRQHPERGRRHARGRLDDELPLPPPPPELPDKSDNDTMGSSKSKLPQDERSSPRRLHFSLRRKPVKKPSPAVADPPAPPPATQLHETKVQPSQEPPPAPPPKLQKVKSDEALMSSSSASKHARGPSNAVSEPVTSNERHHAPEPSDDTVVRIRRERSNTPPSEPDQNEPITPPLKPGQPVQLLPSPTPVPEESPSKWGLTKKPSNSSAMANDVDPKANLHFRGKSSTGFDIFKSTSNELKATTPLSPVLSPTMESPPVRVNENQKPLTSPVNPPTPPKDTPPASPILPSHQLFNSRIRPKRTTAAMLTRIHTACYHAHGRFHRSSQRFVPIDCMMCFSSPPDHQWTCTWCALRICQPCRAKLDAVPRRNLDVIVRGRLQEWEKQRKQRDSMNPQYRNGKPETFRVRGRERSSVVPPAGKLSRGSKSEPLAAGSWD